VHIDTQHIRNLSAAILALAARAGACCAHGADRRSGVGAVLPRTGRRCSCRWSHATRVCHSL
jgi:hypothetical protein